MQFSSVLSALWQFKWVTLSVVLLAVSASLYTLVFAEPTYRATMTFALMTPKTPTPGEVQGNPDLGKLNSDNPYLRSPDSTLLMQVLTTKLSTPDSRAKFKETGLSGEYTVSQPTRDPAQASWGPGMLMLVTASGSSADKAARSAEAVGSQLTNTLKDVQKVNGADDAYLVTALSIGGPTVAEKDTSTALRTIIAIAVASIILLFAGISLGRQVQLFRARQIERHARRVQRVEEEDISEGSNGVLTAPH